MIKLISAILVLLSSVAVQAGVGPDSAWGELYQNRFYEPQTPVIPFHARSSTGADSRLILKKAHDVSVFRSREGREWLYGGTARLCTEYSVTGSLSDSRRRCLAYEEVQLVRDRGTELRYCTFRSDDDCQAYASRAEQLPLEYSVPIMVRTSESDSFTRTRVAFSKTLKIAECGDCAERLGY